MMIILYVLAWAVSLIALYVVIRLAVAHAIAGARLSAARREAVASSGAPPVPQPWWDRS